VGARSTVAATVAPITMRAAIARRQLRAAMAKAFQDLRIRYHWENLQPMKLATLFLMAAALVAGHDGRYDDDHGWNRHNPPPVSAPEPSTYAMMAIGLGVIVVISQRRKQR
jgi:hypothetical protein